MTHKITPSHVAILVPSVRKAADFLRRYDFQIGKEEEWDGEGTKEIYVEREKSNSLLLMEPIKPGAYQRAMDKRGPGLHHLAIDVLRLDDYLESLAGSGWLLHPISIETMKKTRTAYLSRPGFPALIEVQEQEKLVEREIFVSNISIALDASLTKLIKHIGLENIVKTSIETTELVLAGEKFALKDFY